MANTNKTYEPGSVNVKEITEAVKSIEFLTQQYKRKRMSTESYIQSVHENLLRLTSERNYWDYLKNIGQ